MTFSEKPADQGLLSVLFRHHQWSNIRLLDSCLALDDDQLNWSDPGAYGSVWATLAHLVRAEEWYLFLLSGRDLPEPRTDEQTPISELKERARASGTALLEVASSVKPDTEVTVEEGEEAEILPATVILLQAIHHAHEHRTQVTTLLGQQGLEPPPLSGWRYYDEVMAPGAG